MPGHSLPLTLPMTPSAALKLHLDTLSDYERGEILEYTEIYCTGHGADKVRATLMASEATPNHGAAHHPLRAALHPLRAALRRSRSSFPSLRLLSCRLFRRPPPGRPTPWPPPPPRRRRRRRPRDPGWCWTVPC